ncbi:MAG: OsmC family protein [Gemmatimonadaceae bacterium]
MTEPNSPHKPVNRVRVTWVGEHMFDAGRPGGPPARIDASARTGQSPVDALLSALGSCSAVDVVDILAKRRTPVASLEVNVAGTRVTTIPRRLERVLLEFHIEGEGIDRAHAERAVELSVTKYCSVRDSLAPDIEIEWTVVLNGTPGMLINRAPAAGRT